MNIFCNFRILILIILLSAGLSAVAGGDVQENMEGKSMVKGKGIILTTKGFHDLEAIVPMIRLLEEGIKVTIVGDIKGRVCSYNSSHTLTIESLPEEIDIEGYDLIIIPGGKAPARLRSSQAVLQLVRKADHQGKIIAAICHGPQVMVSAGILKGRKVTGVGSIRGEIETAGAQYIDAEVVSDGNLITSRVPSDLPAFCRTIILALSGKGREEKSEQSEMFHKLIKTRRSIRRYRQESIPLEVIKKIVDDARYAPSAGNSQPWKFIVVRNSQLVKVINSSVRWLRGCKPGKGEEPTAYIVVLGDAVNCSFAVENLILGAYAEGIGTCIIGSVNWLRVRKLLKIPASEKLFVIVSMGYPLEESIAEEAIKRGSLRVWKDKSGKVHVPKKPLQEIMSIDHYEFN